MRQICKISLFLLVFERFLREKISFRLVFSKSHASIVSLENVNLKFEPFTMHSASLSKPEVAGNDPPGVNFVTYLDFFALIWTMRNKN